MDIYNVGFGIENFGYLSRKKMPTLGMVYSFEIDGSIEVGESKDSFTGSLNYVPRSQQISHLSLITEKRIASYNPLEALLNVRSLSAGDFSIRGEVRDGSIDKIVAVIGNKEEVKLGNLSYVASKDGQISNSNGDVNDPLKSPRFKDYLMPINLLVVHALIMQSEVVDPDLISDLNDYIRDMRSSS